MLFTANDIEFTFSHATGLLKIPVRDIILIHVDTTYTNSLYFIYTDRLLSIKNRIHHLKYDEIESYNGGEVPGFEDLIIAVKTFAPRRYLGDSSQIQSDWTQADNGSLDFIKNKPTIPGAQIQSDWDQDDDQALDFIKNRPSIPDTQIQSDWDQDDDQALDFIKNKPSIGSESNYWMLNGDYLSPTDNSYILSFGSTNPVTAYFGTNNTDGEQSIAIHVGASGNSLTNIAIYSEAIGGSVSNYSFYGDSGTLFNMDGIESRCFFQLDQLSAPDPTTDRLYNVGGLIYWNGLPFGPETDFWQRNLNEGDYTISPKTANDILSIETDRAIAADFGTVNADAEQCIGVNVFACGSNPFDNFAIYSYAGNATHNYSFYGAGGKLYNIDPVEFCSYLKLNQTSAPFSTTDCLYNIGGSLYWNGTKLD
jgi:hypothetical protein